MALGAESLTNADVEIKGWRFAVTSGILGWVLDAFDFFVVVFLFDTLARQFHVPKVWIVSTLTVTLATRPLGAVLFGFLADKYGRRRPLIFCVLYFSFFTAMTGISPTFAVFVICRALYGIGMGGYWGISASYAMETCPRRFRGFLSGLIQAGYPIGYLLVPFAMQTVVPLFGWRAIFFSGLPIALLVVILMLFAPESKAWKQHRPGSWREMAACILEHKAIFFYLLFMMTVLLSLAHGAQDLYPDFLKSIAQVRADSLFGMKALYIIPVFYNIGAIFGALLFGHLSQKAGRRNSIMMALTVALVAMPAWAFGRSIGVLLAGSFLMQTGVQGAFGVIPAHLNELSPGIVRSLFAGTVYQLGSLLASPSTTAEYMLRDHFGYSVALTIFEAVMIIVMVVTVWFGPEARNRNFLATA